MMFKAKTPHFFKIILDDTIREGKLSIPRKFVKRYENYLSDKAFLRVPSGPKWQVELVKSGDVIWFGKGWQKFVDYYSLSHGSFLVFRFENLKACCFDVIIFDKSASEIDYPIHVDEDNNYYEETNLDQEFHQLNSTTPEIIEIEEKSMSPFSRPLKKMKHENGTGGLDFAVKRTQRLSAEEKAYALSRANGYYKSNNISFSIALQPSHVGGDYRVDVPPSFAKKYIKNERGNIILHSVNEKTWSVEYVYVKTHGIKAVRMCRGWRIFVQDNHLEVGDVCVFEVINHNATELKVVICRGNQDANTSPSIGKKAINDIRDLNKFSTLNPYFKVKLLPSYLDHNQIYVPGIFVAKCKKRSIEKFFLQVDNKVWPVKLTASNPNFRLSTGFSAFANDNSLQIGDVCVFELINADALLLNVAIFRKF